MELHIKRKDKIIQTSIDILDELGFQGLTTKEISKREQISEAAIYKHFKGKAEIICGILDYYYKFDNDIKQTIEINRYSPKQSIRFIAECLGEYYENYPAITVVPFYYEALSHEKGASNKIKETYKLRSNYLTHLIEKGIKEREFLKNTSSEDLANIILGTSRTIILIWRMEKGEFLLKEKLLSTLNIILKAC